jgi:hypothetical protein
MTVLPCTSAAEAPPSSWFAPKRVMAFAPATVQAVDSAKRLGGKSKRPSLLLVMSPLLVAGFLKIAALVRRQPLSPSQGNPVGTGGLKGCRIVGSSPTDLCLCPRPSIVLIWNLWRKTYRCCPYSRSAFVSKPENSLFRASLMPSSHSGCHPNLTSIPHLAVLYLLRSFFTSRSY